MTCTGTSVIITVYRSVAAVTYGGLYILYAYVAENQLIAESGTKVIIEIETPIKVIQCSLNKINVITRDIQWEK